MESNTLQRKEKTHKKKKEIKTTACWKSFMKGEKLLWRMDNFQQVPQKN
jgi:hypothetical protein